MSKILCVNLLKKFTAINLIFISLSIVLVGCQQSWPEPPNLSGVKTVCLNIENSRSETAGHWIYNDEDIERLLGRMDIDFIPMGKNCDATLTLDGRGVPYGDNYKSGASGTTTYCYTGGRVNGKVVFSIPGQDPLVLQIIGSQPKQESISHCYKTAPYYEIIYKQMLQAFIHILGPEFAIRNLVMDEKSYIKDCLVNELEEMGADAAPALVSCLSYDDPYLPGVCARTIGSIEANPWVIQELIKRMESDDLQTRAMAIYAVQNIGPEAEDSISTLILLLDDDRISGYDHVINLDASLALEIITGQQFGIDKDAWLNWLETQID